MSSAARRLITYFACMACCEWWLAIVVRPTEVPRLANNVDITTAHCVLDRLQMRAGQDGNDLLSHALLARWRLNEGWPGGTDCDAEVGLPAVSVCPVLNAARDTYDSAPPPLLVGCAARGCGALGSVVAMNECSPAILLLKCSAQPLSRLVVVDSTACGSASMAARGSPVHHTSAFTATDSQS